MADAGDTGPRPGYADHPLSLLRAREEPLPGGETELRASPSSRVIASGLLTKGRDAVVERLCRCPGDGRLWMRLAEIERSRGALGQAGSAYARAAASDWQMEEARALAVLCAGDPQPAAQLPDGRVAPFILCPTPLPADLVRAILLWRSGEGGASARVGPSEGGRYDPKTRKATIRKLPRALLERVLDGGSSLATTASRSLFASPIALGDPTHSLQDYAHADGYAAHRDVGGPGTPVSDRVFTVVQILALANAPFTGGDLLLYDRRGPGFTRIVPRAGAALAFPAETVHEVTRLAGSPAAGPLRIVLTLWYNRERPATV